MVAITNAPFIFTHFLCTPSHVPAKPSGEFALIHRLLKYTRTSVDLRRRSCYRLILEQLIDQSIATRGIGGLISPKQSSKPPQIEI